MLKSAPVKHIALTLLCSAVLAACGGSGNTSADLVNNAVAARNVIEQIEALDTAENITLEDADAVNAALNSYIRLSDSEKALVNQASREKLEAAVNALAAAAASSSADSSSSNSANAAATAQTITDNDSLPALNLPAPLHTAFISSSGAQQHNPHMQLRNVDGKPALVDTQIGLIRTLEINDNQPVVLDGVVLARQSQSGELVWSQQDSDIIKASSVGTTVTTNEGLTEAVQEIAYYQKDKNGLVFDKAFDGIYALQFADGTRIVLHDPAAAGWTYQTFAHYTDPNNGITHGYQSLGDETPVSAMSASGTATYRGITTAYLAESGKADRQLTADVTAVADFAKKGLRFETSNAQFHTVENGVRVSSADSNYNMSGSAAWANNSNSFKGTVVTADGNMSGMLNGKFYGASAAEIGGTYGLTDGSGNAQLIGGYGAKRP